MSKEGLPIFAGKDFPVWKMVLEQFLGTKGLKAMLTTLPDLKKPEEVKQDQGALSYITRTLLSGARGFGEARGITMASGVAGLSAAQFRL